LLIGVLAGEWLVRSAVHHDYFDGELLADGGVVIVALGLVEFVMWTLIGTAVGSLGTRRRRATAMRVLAVLVALAATDS
jgi:hypothetical protein